MNLATYITVSRFPLTIVMLVFFYQHTKESYLWTLALFAIAILSDVLDGYIARKFDQTSEFGARIDAMIDKVMIYAMLFSLFAIGIYDAAILFSMFFRDMIADSLRSYSGATVCGSNFWGKAKFACQASSVLLGLVYCVDQDFSKFIVLANGVLLIGLVLSFPGLIGMIFNLPKSTLQGVVGKSIPAKSQTKSQPIALRQ